MKIECFNGETTLLRESLNPFPDILFGILGEVHKRFSGFEYAVAPEAGCGACNTHSHVECKVRFTRLRVSRNGTDRRGSPQTLDQPAPGRLLTRNLPDLDDG
jgi:hypothetical protein